MRGQHRPRSGPVHRFGDGDRRPLAQDAAHFRVLRYRGLLLGFYSKDAILDAAFHAGPAAAAAGLLIALGSSLYIFRMLFLTFLGPRPAQKGSHAHEAEAVMSVPILFLAAGALGAGWLAHGVVRMLASGAAAPMGGATSFSWHVFAAGTAMAALGAGAAYYFTTSLPDWDWRWRREFPAVEAVFESDFGWKNVVGFSARGVRRGADWVGRVFDERILDGGIIEATASWARHFSEWGARLSAGSLNDYLWWMMAGTAALMAAALR